MAATRTPYILRAQRPLRLEAAILSGHGRILLPPAQTTMLISQQIYRLARCAARLHGDSHAVLTYTRRSIRFSPILPPLMLGSKSGSRIMPPRGSPTRISNWQRKSRKSCFGSPERRGALWKARRRISVLRTSTIRKASRRERPALKKLGPYMAWIDAILEGG